MKKMIAAIMTLAVMFMATLALAGPASATGGGNNGPEIKGKDVTLCHSGNGKNYTKITVSVNSFFQSGHIDHDDDIWEAFTYIKRTGSDTWETINVPAQGDTSLLAFDDCEAPKDPEKVTVTVNTVDKCATSNDAVTATASNSVVNVQVDKKSATTYEVVAVLDNKTDFVFDLDGSWTVSSDGSRATKMVTLTDEDCDLPETGAAATFATGLGVLALFGAGVVLIGMALTGRKNN